MSTAHTLSGRSTYGFVLTAIVCVLWGVFPIAAKAVLLETDPYTFNFYRFLMPVFVLWAFLARRSQLPELWRGKHRPIRKRVFLAAVLLIANYMLFAFALGRITPSAAQILIQTGTIMILLSGVFLFGETFSKRQWLGCLVFMIGLTTFFFYRILDMFDGLASYTIGMGLMILAAITWACYAILQKPLLTHISPAQILLVVFAMGLAVFFPAADLGAIMTLSAGALLGLGFCSASTLVGTTLFAEAMAHWEASKISALLTTIPLVTMFAMKGLSYFPSFDIKDEPITTLSLSGAILVVVGAAMVAVTRSQVKIEDQGTEQP